MLYEREKKSPWVREGKISVGILGGEGKNLCGKFTHFLAEKKIHFLSKVLKEDWSPPKWQNGLGSGNPVNDKAMYEYIKKYENINI